MARPKIIRFYEQQLQSTLPENQLWLVDYHKNSKILVEYMTKMAKSTACNSTIICLTLLREYLLSKNQIYNLDTSLNWYDSTGPYPKGYRITLLRLSDIYDFGEIKPLHWYRLSSYNQNLTSPWNVILSKFLNNYNHYSEKYVFGELRCSISRFFIYIQNKVTHPHNIDFKLIEEYCNDYLSDAIKSRYLHALSIILLFMADQGLCIHGLGWYPFFKLHNLIFRLSDFTTSQQSIIENCRKDSLIFPAEEFAQIIPDFLERLINYGYSNTQLKIASYVMHNLLLFLEMHGLGYHHVIATIEGEKKCLMSARTLESAFITEVREREHFSDFWDASSYVRNTKAIHGHTMKKTLKYRGKEFTIWVHVFRDDEKSQIENAAFCKQLDDFERSWTNKSVTERRALLNNPLMDFYKWSNLEGDLVREPNVMNGYTENFGFFANISTYEMTTEDAYRIYHERDSIEKCFESGKMSIKVDTARVHHQDTMEGRFVVAFVALSILAELKSQLAKERVFEDGRKKPIKPHTFTFLT